LRSVQRGARRGLVSVSQVRSASSTAAAHQYCLDLVKKHDFDSYVAGLLLPADARNSYFAIRSFNAEIAMIRDNTHGNAMAGRIRFQWWRDLLQEIYHGQNGQASMLATSPVAQALAEGVHKHSLSERWLERSLDARQRDMAGEQPDTLDALENYAEEGHSSLHYLVLQSLGVSGEASEYAASHVGVASGLTTMLRGFPHHASQVGPPLHACVFVYPLSPFLVNALTHSSPLSHHRAKCTCRAN